MAVEMARKLRQNKEPSIDPTADPISGWVDREESRRMWWAKFLDHAILPAWNNAPPMITEDECDLSLPCPDSMYADPIHPPPNPIPFKVAFSLLTPGVASTSSPKGSNHTSPAAGGSSPYLPTGSATSADTLRTLLHSGRTGVSGLSVLLHAIGFRIMRLRWTRSTFSESAAAEAWEDAEKTTISRMMDTWYEALPDSVVQADKAAAGTVQRAVDPRAAVLFISFHIYKVLLYGRWHPLSMVYDDVWLMSSDFLVCVEHADRLTRLLELLVRPAVTDDGTVRQNTAELIRWANPYVFGVSVIMGVFVHAAVLRKLRIMKKDSQTSMTPDSNISVLEATLVAKIELHIAIVETLANKWGLHSTIWEPMREEFIRSTPGSTDLTASRIFSNLNYGPGGKGLLGLFL
ncbi:hypothetical protein HDU93_002183, partial [Gonapodya sp. JEL0774]